MVTKKGEGTISLRFKVMVFNATFNNI
jgi:hypothetical protein